MWTSVVTVVVLSLSGAQAGKLSIVNDRLTYGHLGPVRESAKYLPGDVIHLNFQVESITFDGAGKAFYAMGLEMLDPKGMPLMQQKPQSSTARNYLGGTSLPCAATMQVPLEATPGIYTFRVTVVDSTTKQSVVVARKIEVLARGFGLVHIGTSADAEAAIAWSPVGVVGDSIFLNFSVVGFVRDGKTKQPNIKVAMRVLDEKGQPANSAKLQGEAKSDLPETMAVVPMQFGITLNRAGRFTLELTATDVLAGKTSTVSFPVRVFAP